VGHSLYQKPPYLSARNTQAGGNFGVGQAVHAMEQERGTAIFGKFVQRGLQNLELLLRHDYLFRPRRFAGVGVCEKVGVYVCGEVVPELYFSLVIIRQIDGNMKRHSTGIVRWIVGNIPVNSKKGFMGDFGGNFGTFKALGQKTQQFFGKGFAPKCGILRGLEFCHVECGAHLSKNQRALSYESLAYAIF
jgi:hypothetical protein